MRSCVAADEILSALTADTVSSHAKEVLGPKRKTARVVGSDYRASAHADSWA